jgi:hypothetical protein
MVRVKITTATSQQWRHRAVRAVRMYTTSPFSALDGVGGRRHARATLLPGNISCTGGWVGPRTGMDRWGKSHPQRSSNPGPCSPQQVAVPDCGKLGTLISHSSHEVTRRHWCRLAWGDVRASQYTGKHTDQTWWGLRRSKSHASLMYQFRTILAHS